MASPAAAAGVPVAGGPAAGGPAAEVVGDTSVDEDDDEDETYVASMCLRPAEYCVRLLHNHRGEWFFCGTYWEECWLK